MTDYEKVFKPFLAKIQDVMYVELQEELALEDLVYILNLAILNFENSRVDLKDKDDELMIFNNELGFDEIQILSELMTYGWLKRQAFNIEMLRPSMTPIEFKKSNPAMVLRGVQNLLTFTEKQLHKLKLEYGRRNREK